MSLKYLPPYLLSLVIRDSGMPKKARYSMAWQPMLREAIYHRPECPCAFSLGIPKMQNVGSLDHFSRLRLQGTALKDAVMSTLEKSKLVFIYCKSDDSPKLCVPPL